MRPISHEKKTHLGKICVTVTYLMVKFYEKTKLSDVICEGYSKSSGLTSKENLEKTISTKITNATNNISSNIQF